MRTGQLRALIKELRAGGVSEYTQVTKAGTYSLKLGSVPNALPETKAKAPAKATVQAASAAQAQLEAEAKRLGVTVSEMREAAALLGN